MQIKSLLKKCIEKKIIHLIDYHFSLLVSSNKESILMLVAACVNAITREGHLCLPLRKNNQFKNNKSIFLLKKLWKIIAIKKNFINLKKNNGISDGFKLTPLVLSQNSIYLYKMWKLEKNIAQFFNKNDIEKKYTTKKISHVLLTSTIFSSLDILQKTSILISLLFKKSIIIGCPGTGKTTIISKLILALIKLSDNKITITLSATTGKAASRLQNSLKENLYKFNLTKAETTIFPLKAITLHNLLKINPKSQKLYFHANNVLNTDVLIVDEASMIDIEMMNYIINAISDKTKLILVGDFDQLPAINNGLILKDLCHNSKNVYSSKITMLLNTILPKNKQLISTKNKKNLITDQICILKKNYRFQKNSEIYKISKLVFQGNPSNLNKLFNNDYKYIKFFEIYNQLLYKKMLQKNILLYNEYWQCIYKQNNLEKIINTFNKNRIICALNQGIFGTNTINKLIELTMQKMNIIKNNQLNTKVYYIGKPIIITKNQKSLGLFNGDIGIILPDKNKILKAFFLLLDKSIKIIPIVLIEEYKTAWSITIHRSQGSEFNNVIMILPNKKSSILTRELIYTGITRSKQNVTIYSSQKNFMEAIKTNITRYSNLRKLLNN